MADEKKPKKSLGRLSPGDFFRGLRARYLDRPPRKRSINLLTVSEPRINPFVATPLIIVILVAVGLLGKFAVWDRMALAREEAGRVTALQEELAEQYRYLERYEDVEERYAHYTYSGMTTAERQRVNRLEIMELLRRIVLPRTTLDSWTVSENTVSLSIRSPSLEDVNMLVQLLLSEPAVDYCGISTANSGKGDEEGEEPVSAVLTVLLQRDDAREDAE